jgi:hypothetical protein
MAYRILADMVVGVHLLFVTFVVAGGLLALRWAWAAAAHLPAAVCGGAHRIQGLDLSAHAPGEVAALVGGPRPMMMSTTPTL